MDQHLNQVGYFTVLNKMNPKGYIKIGFYKSDLCTRIFRKESTQLFSFSQVQSRVQCVKCLIEYPNFSLITEQIKNVINISNIIFGSFNMRK